MELVEKADVYFMPNHVDINLYDLNGKWVTEKRNHRADFMVFTSLLSRGRFDGLRRSVEARSEQPTLD